jgi:hypothetical protein
VSGVPRKLAGWSPGADQRHPSGALLCLHVSMPGSDGPDNSPPPLGRSSSSPCRRLGYIVTEGPATTSNLYMHISRQPQWHPLWGPTSAYTCPLPGTEGGLYHHQFPLDATRSQWAAVSDTLCSRVWQRPAKPLWPGRSPARDPAQDPPEYQPGSGLLSESVRLRSPNTLHGPTKSLRR